jgi:hypothetical protein
VIFLSTVQCAESRRSSFKEDHFQNRRESLVAERLFLCTNPACSLGSRKDGGQFTGGATKGQITTLTGDPEPEHVGEGVCPNCGELGDEIGTHESAVGDDPYDDLHQQVAGMVADENIPVNKDNAQAELHDLVEERENPSVEGGEQ